MFEKQKQEWSEMDPKWRAVVIAVIVAGSAGIFVVNQRNNAQEEAKKRGIPGGASTAQAADAQAIPGAKPYNWSTLPPTNRNQGLEDLITEVRQLKEEVNQFKTNTQAMPRAPRTDSQAPLGQVDLNAPILSPSKEDQVPAVRFDLPKDGAAKDGFPKPDFSSLGKSVLSTGSKSAPEPLAPPAPKVWQPAKVEVKEVDTSPKIVIPVNAGLEAVLLSGVAARPSGSTGGAIGSAVSANSVGAPFVTRIKGDAILPNGWKLNELGDCFLGGSAVAVLSAERAYAISETLSCVAPNGDVYEGPVKAYGLDVDGTLGLAGKVVSKQGAILFQALLTGIASGLGAALTPTPIAGLNTAAANGSAQGVQYADSDTIARTALGTGIGNATSQLSRFYLEFAKETFPVIEVVAGTRITWILKESIELKRSKKAS